MTVKTDRIFALLGDLDADETAEVAREALDLLGSDQIVQLVLQLDDITKGEIAAHLSEGGTA